MWPKMMDATEYLRLTYTGQAAPTIRTLKRRINTGLIPGVREGNRYYVWVGPDNRPMPPVTETDKLADKILQNWLEDTPRVAAQSQRL